MIIGELKNTHPRVLVTIPLLFSLVIRWSYGEARGLWSNLSGIYSVMYCKSYYSLEPVLRERQQTNQTTGKSLFAENPKVAKCEPSFLRAFYTRTFWQNSLITSKSPITRPASIVESGVRSGDYEARTHTASSHFHTSLRSSRFVSNARVTRGNC